MEEKEVTSMKKYPSLCLLPSPIVSLALGLGDYWGGGFPMKNRRAT